LTKSDVLEAIHDLLTLPYCRGPRNGGLPTSTIKVSRQVRIGDASPDNKEQQKPASIAIISSNMATTCPNEDDCHDKEEALVTIPL